MMKQNNIHEKHIFQRKIQNFYKNVFVFTFNQIDSISAQKYIYIYSKTLIL